MTKTTLLALSLLAIAPVADAFAGEALQKKALIIGIDGCRPDALLAAKAPNLHALIKNGAFSDKAQTGDMTASGSGWGSLLTGVWREKHGVRGNTFDQSNFAEFPDMLSRIKKVRPESYVASIVHWDPIQKLIVKTADVNAAYKTDPEVTKAACQLLADKNPDLLFVHLDDVDGAGHKHGFDPKLPMYLEGIGKADEQVGEILKAVESRKTYKNEDWLVVVSTDHGGSGKGHGANTPEHRTIFVIVSGKAAAKGTIEPAPGIVDVAPTVMKHLGIPIEANWKLDGKAVGLGEVQAKQKKVLLLGIDGCRPDAIAAATVAHNLHQLVKEGGFYPKMDVLGDHITGVPTATGPGWSSVLTGVWADKHGVKDNLLRENKFKDYPTFFRRFREARPEASTAALVSWIPFAEEVFSKADGRQLLVDGDTKGYDLGDRAVAKATVEVLTKGNPDLVFAYFGQVDVTGHGYGFHPKSPRYTAALEFVDDRIGEILAALKKRATYDREDWLIVVCTDHGGRGRDHLLGEKEPQMRTGMMILHGPSAKKGVFEERAFNVDIAATVLTHLGVPLRSEWKLDGKAIGLEGQR